MHKQIAKVEYTQLGWEDHGIFTAIIGLDYGGSSQSVGMYSLSYRPNKEHIGAQGGIAHIMRIMEACGVDQWEKIKGRTIYAIREEDGWDTKVIGIGPLPTEEGRDFIFSDVVLWPEEQKNE